MKYSMSCRQPQSFLEKADEIYVEERDWRVVPDLFIKYSEKPILLEWSIASNITQDQILNLATAGNLICCIDNLKEVEWFKSNNIKFYYKYPVSTFYEINGLRDLGAEYVKIMAPLTFQMDKLAMYDMKFRMVPNVSYSAYIPRVDGICGQWVRPEDVQYYEDAIYVFDFEDADLMKERTLYHIYAENQMWPGNLNLLLSNFGVDVDNRGLPDELGEIRANCGQRCQENGACHFCSTSINFSNVLKRHKYQKQK